MLRVPTGITPITFLPTWLAPTQVSGFKVASAGVDMAAAIEDLVFKFYKQQARKAAWKQTRLAIADPDNRKLNLIVREMNPALAKYSLAYGALIEKDTTAPAAMDRAACIRRPWRGPTTRSVT